MSIEGYVDYRRREFCNDIQCKVQILLNTKKPSSEEYEKIREICRDACIHSTYEFHHWLIEKGFLVVRLANIEQQTLSENSSEESGNSAEVNSGGN